MTMTGHSGSPVSLGVAAHTVLQGNEERLGALHSALDTQQAEDEERDRLIREQNEDFRRRLSFTKTKTSDHISAELELN